MAAFWRGEVCLNVNSEGNEGRKRAVSGTRYHSTTNFSGVVPTLVVPCTAVTVFCPVFVFGEYVLLI